MNEPKRKPGRPRVVEGPSSIVSVRIWAGHHDRLITMARERRMPVSDLVRNILSTAATMKRRAG